MSLQDWANNGWLRPHQTSAQEIADLLRIVERDLADAEGNISADWRFGIAYNGALKLCTILLQASGYRAEIEPSALPHDCRAAADSRRASQGRCRLSRTLSPQAQHDGIRQGG